MATSSTTAACAGATNENSGFESFAATSETVESSVPLTTVSGSARTGDDWLLENEEEAAATESTEVEIIPFDIAIPDVAPARPLQEKSTTDVPRSLRGHMAVLANASAPERARSVSIDALFTALSGGYELEQRLAMARALVGNADVAYDSLLKEHLRDMEAEARVFDLEGLAGEVAALLENLEASTR